MISLLVPKYHIYIEYAESELSGFRFNLSHEELNRTFAWPFAAGQPFWFMGKLLSPVKVIKAILFWSYETADKLKLPDQESLVTAKDQKYKIESILKGRVRGAYLCTEEFMAPTKKAEATNQSVEVSLGNTRRRIFVVSGTDNSMKQALTAALTKLSLAPVVIHEEPRQGRKILERYADYADVGFAVVLLSPDDCVYPKEDKTTKSKLKPRQDIIFLLGYLLGKLGREKVLVFFKECTNFETPNDFEGINFCAFDDRGSWKLALIRELTNSGYSVDGEKILK